MEGERSFATRSLKVVGFGLLAFAITILAGGIWSGLVVANLQSTPAVKYQTDGLDKQARNRRVGGVSDTLRAA
jgi:hypothetical protein